MRGCSRSRTSRSKGGHAVRRAAVSAWAVAFLLTIGLGGAFAGTRLIAHFENAGGTDAYGRDVLASFYDSQGVGADTNLYPNQPLPSPNNSLPPFPLVNILFTAGGSIPTDPFEIHQFAADGTVPGPGFLVGENRFAAFGSGWSLGAQDQVEDFQINFINVANEAPDDDVRYRPGPPGLGGAWLADNVVTGTVQDWSAYGALCFYLCVNASDIPATVPGPDNDFWDNFKVQVWEYWVEVQGPPWVVVHNEREIYEVSLSDILSQNGVGPFTGWRHLRVPFSSFQRVDWSNTYWRYGNFVSQEAFYGNAQGPGMNGSLDPDAVRAIIFRKGPIVDATGNPTELPDRITVAIDEIAVTGDTAADVLRVNMPGQVEPIPAGLPNAGETRCDDTQDRGLCWAQLFQDDVDQVRPYRNPVKPATGGTADPNRNVDVVVTVRDWQQLCATFSAEVGNGAVVSATDISSEIVFVPQFQAPGTWVQRGLVGPDFLRRKGTIRIPGARESLFYTDWRYDYTSGVAAENYLVHYNPLQPPGFARLDPSAQPRGGFLANYFRDFTYANPNANAYAYGTLFVLPRDAQGNIGRAWTIDVLFDQSAGQLGYERLTTGRP